MMRVLDANGNAAPAICGPERGDGLSSETLWSARVRIYVIRMNLRQSGVDRTQTATYTLR